MRAAKCKAWQTNSFQRAKRAPGKLFVGPQGPGLARAARRPNSEARKCPTLTARVGLVRTSYTPKSFDSTSFTDWKLASDSVSNNTTSPLTTTITVTTQQQTATTLKLSTSAKGTVFGIVEVAVTTEASETWTDTYTFSQAITVTAQPGEKVSIESRDPIKRVTGDFTLTMGNTTWNLYDVNFDSPDPDRRSEYNAITTPIRAVV